MKKLLVTGGNGFIARHLVEQLSGKFEIVSRNSRDLNLLDADAVRDCIEAGAYDVVVHTATWDAAPKHSTKDPAKIVENNLRMFFNVARCEDYFGRMLYFGSGAEFDREHWVPRMKEEYFDRYVPSDRYGFSKYIMTKYALENKKIYNLRLFAVFGRYEDYLVRFISNACCHAVLGLPIRIRQNARYDFLDITDLAKIVAWFIETAPRANVYNICTGAVHEFKAIAGEINRISGKKLDIIVQADGLGREYGGDNTLLTEEMEGFAFRPLAESVRELYGWYELHKRSIDRDALLASV
jgi:GDP-L-fucose synthase